MSLITLTNLYQHGSRISFSMMIKGIHSSIIIGNIILNCYTTIFRSSRKDVNSKEHKSSSCMSCGTHLRAYIQPSSSPDTMLHLQLLLKHHLTMKILQMKRMIQSFSHLMSLRTKMMDTTNTLSAPNPNTFSSPIASSFCFSSTPTKPLRHNQFELLTLCGVQVRS